MVLNLENNMEKLELDNEEIKRFYEIENKSCVEIANIYRCGVSPILYRLKKMGINLRGKNITGKSLKRRFPLNENQLINLYSNEKKSSREISKIFGCSKGTITRRLKMFGIKPREPNYKEKEIEKYKSKIIEGYEKGFSTYYLAKEYGYSPGFIYKLLKKWGIKFRKNIYNRSGSKFIADDGHIVQSSVELFIDNWLFHNGIIHIYNKLIGFGDFRTDFYIPKANIWIEYWGLQAIKRYREKTKRKVRFYKTLGLNLLSLFPFDDIQQKLKFLLQYSQNQAKLNEFEIKDEQTRTNFKI